MDIKFIGTRDTVLQGTRNDIIFDPLTKDLTGVTGINYVKQKITKVLLTSINSDPNFLTYGTTLSDQVFEDINDPATHNNIVETIMTALNYIEGQETSTRDDEHIKSVENIDLLIDPLTQSAYVSMLVTLRNNQTVTIAIGS